MTLGGEFAWLPLVLVVGGILAARVPSPPFAAELGKLQGGQCEVATRRDEAQ